MTSRNEYLSIIKKLKEDLQRARSTASYYKRLLKDYQEDLEHVKKELANAKWSLNDYRRKDRKSRELTPNYESNIDTFRNNRSRKKWELHRAMQNNYGKHSIGIKRIGERVRV